MRQLTPLQHSAAYDQAEAELKALTIHLWQKHFADAAEDINVYAAPHWGSRDLILKNLKADGIASFNTINLERDPARYLLMAERHKNQKRGLHFLRTFIKCAWGNEFEISQLWQPKDQPYPNGLQTAVEINDAGLSRNAYFLTSRLRIELSGFVKPFPSDVARSVRSVLAARLFVADVLRTVPLNIELAYAEHTEIESSCEMEVSTEILDVEVSASQTFADYGQVISFASLEMTA